MLNKALSWLAGLVCLVVVASDCRGQAAAGGARCRSLPTLRRSIRPTTLGSITLTWGRSRSIPEGAIYKAYIAEANEGPYYLASEIAGGANLQSEEPETFGYGDEARDAHFLHIAEYAGREGVISLQNDKTYYVRLELHSGNISTRAPVLTASAEGNYFNWTKLNNIVLGALLSFLILGFISLARRRDLYIRRIGGLEALDEALGRATEMGKPVLFIHGLRDMSQISTIAAVNILGRVACRTAMMRRCAWLLPIPS